MAAPRNYPIELKELAPRLWRSELLDLLADRLQSRGVAAGRQARQHPGHDPSASRSVEVNAV